MQPDEIGNNLPAHNAKVSSTESYPHDFLARKAEVEQDIDFETEGHRTYKVPFTLRELGYTLLPVTQQRDWATFLKALYVNYRLYVWHFITPYIDATSCLLYTSRCV